jgi:hypothetical protein
VGIGLLFAASLLFVAAQHPRDLAANRSKLLPLKARGNQAETRQDARALDARMDNSLVYTE